MPDLISRSFEAELRFRRTDTFTELQVLCPLLLLLLLLLFFLPLLLIITSLLYSPAAEEQACAAANAKRCTTSHSRCELF